MSFDPSKFTTPQAKPLPVILLLDVSGSMSVQNKIDHLNNAVREMIESFAQEEKMETEIIISVITFGESVELQIPFTRASQVVASPLIASGLTPMGTALKMAKAMIEDKEATPSRAYRPTVVLVSDGQPTDNWQGPLDDFVSNGRSSKCDRMAMAIGRDADASVLNRFIAGTPHELFTAANAGQLHEFFKRVTMSVTIRSQSKNPNEVLELPSPAEKQIEPLASQNNDNGDEGFW